MAVGGVGGGNGLRNAASLHSAKRRPLLLTNPSATHSVVGGSVGGVYTSAFGAAVGVHGSALAATSNNENVMMLRPGGGMGMLVVGKGNGVNAISRKLPNIQPGQLGDRVSLPSSNLPSLIHEVGDKHRNLSKTLKDSVILPSVSKSKTISTSLVPTKRT